MFPRESFDFVLFKAMLLTKIGIYVLCDKYNPNFKGI